MKQNLTPVENCSAPVQEPLTPMTTSKKSSASKSMLSLRDFDPENEDFGSEVSGLMARNKKGASLQHGHLGDVKTSATTIGDGFDDKKYAGKSVSRKELYSSEEEDEFDDSESEMNSEDYNSEDSEDYDSEEADFSTDQSDYESDSEGSESNISDNDYSDSKHFGDSGLSARMRELEMADEKAFDLVSQARSSPVDDAQKSHHVRNQLVKFDDYVDLRFKLQPLLNSFNRLPGKKQLRRAKRRSAEISETLNETVGELEGLMKDLLELSVSELKNDSIAVPEDINPKASDSSMQKYWDEITRIDAALDPFARSSLQKWHNKMTLASDMKAKKTLKMLNQDPYQQVQIALQDEERLVSRSRLYRDNSKRRLGCDHENENGRVEYEDIYDDNDFYQVLLKDWTASHGALSSSTASAMSAVLLPAAKKQHRENVDQRASKGRKIRYDVHAKLINYMVPQIEKGAWTDSKIDEFYASLLGQSKQN